jgi:hypothetical protein
MVFVRDVSADEARDAWREGFENNCADVASLADAVAIFGAAMRDTKAGDSMVLDFSGDTVDVRINDVEIEAVRAKAFQQALLAIWLGPKPIDRDLKEGILGPRTGSRPVSGRQIGQIPRCTRAAFRFRMETISGNQPS